MEKEQVKINLGIPCYSTVPVQCFMAAANIMQDPQHRVRGCTILEGHPVARVRNQIVETFLETNHTHLYFMDTDTIAPANVIDLMLECDWPLAAGIYLIMRPKGIVPCVQVELGDPEGWLDEWNKYDEPFEAEFAGTGCVMIHRKVFEDIGFPWFDYDEGCYGVTEDFWFARKMKEHGYTYKVNPRLYAEHFKSLPVGKFAHDCSRGPRQSAIIQELALTGV